MPLIISRAMRQRSAFRNAASGAGEIESVEQDHFHLMPCAEQKLTICTPYFNLPAILVRNIIQLLREGKKGRNYCW